MAVVGRAEFDRLFDMTDKLFDAARDACVRVREAGDPVLADHFTRLAAHIADAQITHLIDRARPLIERAEDEAFEKSAAAPPA